MSITQLLQPEVKEEEPIPSTLPIHSQSPFVTQEITMNTEISLGMEDVKVEDTLSEGQNTKRGRPKKYPIVTYDTIIQNQVKQTKIISQTINDKQSHPKEGECSTSIKLPQSLSQRKRQKQKVKLKASDPTEQDLCQALLSIKKKLPHRSLEKVILKMFQTVQTKNKQNGNHTDIGQNYSFKSNTPTESIAETSSQKKSPFISSHSQIQQKEQTATSNTINDSNSTLKLVFPGKKISPYHNISNDIAATSHQYYKTNPPTLQELQALEKQLGTLPIVSKPLLEPTITSQLKQEQPMLSLKNDLYFQFNQSQTLRTNFLSPLQQQKFQQRRQIALIFIERGFGITKAIDQQLPPMDIDRRKYRNLLGGILTMTFRKIESFIACQLRITIKYLDLEQMKAVSLMLVNCRVHLEPNHCQTYLKFVRITFGLGDLIISQNQTIDLYVGILKHLYGKNITLATIQKMGEISNRRNLQSKMPVLKKIALKQKQKHLQTYPINSTLIPPPTLFEKELKDQNLLQSNNESGLSIWSPDIDRQLLNLYVQYKDLSKIRTFLQEIYIILAGFSIQQFQNRISVLAKRALRKIQEDAHKYLPNGPFLQNIDSQQTEFLLASGEGEPLKIHILNYSLNGNYPLLQQCICSINQFLYLHYQTPRTLYSGSFENGKKIKLETDEFISLESNFNEGQANHYNNQKNIAKTMYNEMNSEVKLQNDLFFQQSLQLNQFDGLDPSFLQELDFQPQQ